MTYISIAKTNTMIVLNKEIVILYFLRCSILSKLLSLVMSKFILNGLVRLDC